MQWFLSGMAIVYTVLAGWAVRDHSDDLAQQMILFAMLVGVPISAAWLAGEAFLWMSPRRIFDLRVRSRVALVVGGVFAGLGGTVFSTALLGVLERQELLILGGCAAGMTVLVFGRFSRAKNGQCVHCQYDLDGTFGARCPECGAFHSRIGTRPESEDVRTGVAVEA